MSLKELPRQPASRLYGRGYVLVVRILSLLLAVAALLSAWRVSKSGYKGFWVNRDVVIEVVRGSPAEAAGFRVNDVLLSWDGIDPRDWEKVFGRMWHVHPGEVHTARVARVNQQFDLSLIVGPQPIGASIKYYVFCSTGVFAMFLSLFLFSAHIGNSRSLALPFWAFACGTAVYQMLDIPTQYLGTTDLQRIADVTAYIGRSIMALMVVHLCAIGFAPKTYARPRMKRFLALCYWVTGICVIAQVVAESQLWSGQILRALEIVRWLLNAHIGVFLVLGLCMAVVGYRRGRSDGKGLEMRRLETFSLGLLIIGYVPYLCYWWVSRIAVTFFHHSAFLPGWSLTPVLYLFAVWGLFIQTRLQIKKGGDVNGPGCQRDHEWRDNGGIRDSASTVI